LFVRH